MPSTCTPVARLANTLLRSVGPAFSLTTTPVAAVVASAKRRPAAAAVAVAPADSLSWPPPSFCRRVVPARTPGPETSMPTLRVSAVVAGETVITSEPLVVLTSTSTTSPPKMVLLTILPKGTAAVGTLPVFGSPLKKIPAVPLVASTLLATTTPGTSRELLRTGRLRGTPGTGALVLGSRTPASMLIP